MFLGGGGVVKRIMTAASGAFSPTCTSSSNWLARATNVTLTADKQNYNDLLCGLTTDGLINSDGTSSFLDVLYIFAAPDSTTALLNLIQNSFNGTANGTVNFSAYNGFTGNGGGAANFYIDTGYKCSGSGLFTQNSGSGGVYILSSRTTNQNWLAFGQDTNNFDLGIATKGATTDIDYFVSGAHNTAIINANAQGSYIISRTSSTRTDVYKNGSSTPIFTNSSDNSTAVAANNVYFFAINDSPAGRFTGDQHSAGFIGAGLSSAQAANLMARINTYMTAYGINVY